jgi:uncharacterized protein
MIKKRILVDINHPAHVHLFKYFVADMKARGNEVIVTAKNVSSITTLLTNYNIPFTTVGVKKDGLIWKYVYELLHIVQVWYLVIVNRIDYGIGVSMVLPVVSKLSQMIAFSLDDDDLVVTPIFGRFVSMADVIVTPESLASEDRGPNRICHPSFHELAYLHPDRFRPDPAILEEVGVLPGEPFFILRFNAFKAHHDLDAMGLSLDQKLALVALLEPKGKLFITTERDIEPALKAYQMLVSPEKIHSLMYYATMFLGDSQTMISEAALLGTPAIKLNSFAGRLSIPNEIEQRYGLCYSFLPNQFDQLFTQVQTLLERPDLKAEWRRRQAVMLADKVDLTSFLVNLVAEYPTSIK